MSEQQGAVKEAPSTNRRVVRHVFTTYRSVERNLTGQLVERVRTGMQGDPVEVGEVEERRLDALGALEPLEGGETPRDAIERALNPLDRRPEHAASSPARMVSVSPPPLGAEPHGTLTVGDTGTADAVAPDAGDGDGGAGSPAAPPSGGGFDARGASVSDAEAWIREERPNAAQTVAAANDDPDAADVLLEAERLVTGGDPRKTVAEPLQAIIDQA